MWEPSVDTDMNTSYLKEQIFSGEQLVETEVLVVWKRRLLQMM